MQPRMPGTPCNVPDRSTERVSCDGSIPVDARFLGTYADPLTHSRWWMSVNKLTIDFMQVRPHAQGGNHPGRSIDARRSARHECRCAEEGSHRAHPRTTKLRRWCCAAIAASFPGDISRGTLLVPANVRSSCAFGRKPKSSGQGDAVTAGHASIHACARETA